MEEKKKEAEKRLLEKQRKKLEREQKRLAKRRRKWTLLYKNNANPYERTFKPRLTKVGERIHQS
jgi:hypothetical protein